MLGFWAQSGAHLKALYEHFCIDKTNKRSHFVNILLLKVINFFDIANTEIGN